MSKSRKSAKSSLNASNSEPKPDLVEVYEKFFPKISRFMYYRVGSFDAEDLTSEVFLRVVRHLRGPKDSLGAWIYRIAHNVSVDHLRSARVKREMSICPDDQEKLLDGKATTPDPAIRIDIQSAIEKLGDEQREVITQKFMLGLSNREIEEISGRKPAATRALQFRALKALRAILDEGDTEQ